jgi:hypothetical protein
MEHTIGRQLDFAKERIAHIAEMRGFAHVLALAHSFSELCIAPSGFA